MKKSILEVVHESAKGLFDIGLIDVKTMHSFDAKCLPPIKKLSPRQRKDVVEVRRLLNQIGAHTRAVQMRLNPLSNKMGLTASDFLSLKLIVQDASSIMRKFESNSYETF